MSPAQRTLEQLDETRQWWWLFSMLCNVVLAILLSLAVLAACVMLDVGLQLPRGWLLGLFLLWTGLSLCILLATIVRAMTQQRSLAGVARQLESSYPSLGSHLINLVQLVKTSSESDTFQQAAIADAAARVGQQRVVFRAASQQHSRWHRWRLGLQTPRDLSELALLLALLLALIVGLHLLLPTWSSATARLLTPWRFVPQTGSISILEVLPGDVEVLVGSRLEITARIADDDGQPVEATLFLRTEGAAKEVGQAMYADPEGTTFTSTLPAVLHPLEYRLQIGDSQTAVYRVSVRRPPAIRNVEVRYEFPGYLQRPDDVIQQLHADLQAPQFTMAHLRLECSTASSDGYVLLGERKLYGRLADERTLEVPLPMIESSSFTVHIADQQGAANESPRVNSLRAVADAPPGVQLLKPAVESTAAPGSDLTVVVRAADDHGLGEVLLQWRPLADETADEPDRAPQVLHRWPNPTAPTATTLTHSLTLTPTEFAAGTAVQLRAVAYDRRRVVDPRLGPQQAATAWHTLRLIAPQEAAAAELQRLESWTARLWAILQKQIRARLQAAVLLRETDLTSTDNVRRDILQQQIEVQTATAEISASIQPQGDDTAATLKQALNKLAYGEMLRAVEQSQALAKQRIDAAAASLMETQDRVIDVLRKLLEITRRETSESLAEMKDRPGGDLPDDVQDKLTELLKKLDEFLEQQRRVIEATKQLAKKPVEDFSEQEQQLLEQLAAAEDEWSRFMQEAFSDFSKLPEQDFANPSLLQELVEVQTELKMAAGALTKKTADIAVPLEQLGAEMAEELTTNIEKWLPDTPDRERWSQEEPLDDAMKEAPMAELPGELEDLIGELMEDEEDLFDEMEDVSSSWADSLDKGAGWDAADGPISNMSAKGVTGNRLPNTSEIGGRSGEGRQGKSSGEFVGDTAVGKGGRKTPSRLAPDPFVKGQVRDLSKDPVGGATGGGKESGVGGEGLEGPTPQQAQRELERMATKQADLRNRAESIDLKFQVLNYHHTDLQKLMNMMAAVEADLRSGKYLSALRRREVLLEGLSGLKTYLHGEFEVQRDRTSNLPAEIQRELLGSMQEPSPLGWEALNRSYFERLSDGPGASSAAAEANREGEATPPKTTRIPPRR